MDTPPATATDLDQTPHSHDTDQSVSVPRKRRRRILACTLCHQRKLKCDQTLPICGRCLKTGATCTYSDNRRLDAGRSNPPAKKDTAKSDTIATPEDNSAKVVRDFTSPARSDAFASAGVILHRSEVPAHNRKRRETTQRPLPTLGPDPSSHPPETMLFKGAEFATQFFGATNPVSPLLHFPELRNFIGGAFRTAFATFPRLADDLKSLQNSIRGNSKRYADRAEVSILVMIPSQGVAKSLAELYFDRFEVTYRILHAPKFWKDFNSSWDGSAKADSTFSVILLLVVLIAKTIAPADWIQKAGLDFTGLETAPVIVETCEAWISTQSKKHLTLELFQIRILIHVAKQINNVQLKQTWTSSGTLLRFAMAAGLHREPNLLDNRISLYNKEMRRMLWATIVELDLQASLDRGMASSLGGQRWDCKAPKNIDDDAFDDANQSMPISKPSQDFTSMSFLHLSQKSIHLRTELCSLLNEPVPNLSHEQVLAYADQITILLDELPRWSDGKEGMVRRVLEIQLRQYLLLIHFRFHQKAPGGEKQNYSTFVCASTAASILQGYRKLRESGYSAYSLSSIGGILRPSLALCQIVSTSTHPSSGFPIAAFADIAAKSFEDALIVLQDNVMSTGRGFKEYWWVSGAYSFMQVQITTNEQTKSEREREAWERVASLCYRVIATGKIGALNGKTSPADSATAAGEQPNLGGIVTIPNVLGQEQMALSNFGEKGLVVEPVYGDAWIEMPDISQWTFTDGWNLDYTDFE